MLTQVGVKQLTDFLRTVTAASDLVDCTLVNCELVECLALHLGVRMFNARVQHLLVTVVCGQTMNTEY